MFGLGSDKPRRRGERGEILPEPHEGLPDSERPSGLCPRCGKQSSFEIIASLPITFAFDARFTGPDGTISHPHFEQASTLICRHCRQGLVVVEEEYVGGSHHSEGRSGAITWRGIHWWPLASARISRDVPLPIALAFDEAARALSARCPRASAVMARRTLEAVASDQGANDGTLNARLASLASAGHLPPTLADWAKEVRLVGNVGAHFDPLANVSADDAAQLVRFLRELLRYVYELPAELDRRRAPEK